MVDQTPWFVSLVISPASDDQLCVGTVQSVLNAASSVAISLDWPMATKGRENLIADSEQLHDALLPDLLAPVSLVATQGETKSEALEPSLAAAASCVWKN